MKYYTGLLFAILITVTACKSASKTSGVSPLKIMTYNIRLDVASDGENAWPNRKEFLSSQVLFHSPDILGIQEARPHQMMYLKSMLTEYKTIGIGRRGENKGEHSSIFYNSKKLKVEKEATFWLSETPTIFSQGWDAAHPRICTYGLFTQLDNNKKIWVFNTHLDNRGTESRLKGTALILEKIEAVNTGNFPVIVMGDFNVEPNSELIVGVKQKMNDSRDIAPIIFGPNGTFNGFNSDEPVTRRIDYILLSKTEQVDLKKYGVLSTVIASKYPSDHFPVLVELDLN